MFKVLLIVTTSLLAVAGADAAGLNGIPTEFPSADRAVVPFDGSTTFTTQAPAAPSMFDHQLLSSFCDIDSREMEVKWLLPEDGVTSETGLLIVLAGISLENDCARPFYPPDPEWADHRNVVIAQVYYRNLGFFPPYDFGKYQIIDVLRGTNAVLETFPQIDRRRLYLYGGSGGGLAGLQTVIACPQIWAEVYIHSAITRVTTGAEAAEDYPNDPQGTVYGGWNVNMQFPESQGELTDKVWNRYRAERALRGPQNGLHSRT